VTYVLPILPAEIMEPIADGVVAVLRPMDHAEVAALFDTWTPNADNSMPLAAAPWVVRRQLLRIEGLQLGEAPATVPFDADNATHHAALPFQWVQRLAGVLYGRMNLTEATAKNSAAPSVSAAPMPGAD
jgi:hypothetical protein